MRIDDHRPSGQAHFSRRQTIGLMMTGLASVWAPTLFAQPSTGARAALVIGNAAYLIGSLRNSVNDARLIASTLRRLAYDVEQHEDMAMPDMLKVLDGWIQRTALAETRVLYFAGHGAQFRGQNYVIPVDAVLSEEADLLKYTINFSDVIDRMARSGQSVNIIVLDSCRSGLPPLEPTRGQPKQAKRRIKYPPAGTIVAYAAAPGAVAMDGRQSNGPYAKHLAVEMLIPAATVENVFKRVRSAVAQETGNRQIPWETSSLVGEVCLRPGARGECGANPPVETPVDAGKSR
jgi:uncharacterized caspase-like protein